MKAIVYTKIDPPEALRPVPSNQAHSPLTVRLGLDWRSVALHCQNCKRL
jgi:hypothetical protein